MKKLIAIFLFLVLAVSGLQAQSNPRIVKAKKMFFAQELNLSMDQIESFWPTYEQMRSKLMNIAHEKKITCSDPKKLEECLESDERYVRVRNKYLLDISNKIGRNKAMRIPSVEKDFVKEVRRGINKR